MLGTDSIPAASTSEKPRSEQVSGWGFVSRYHRLCHRHVAGRVLLALTVFLIAWLGWISAGTAHDGARTPHIASSTKHRLLECARIPSRATYRRKICIIHAVFGADGPSAVKVARCESGPTINLQARDYATGTHWGAFQLGPAERRAYGHGRTMLAQARAAKRLHAARGWSPWVCPA